MMHVALIVPNRPYLINQKALPNLGVLYVSAALKRLGHDVAVLDYADGWKYVDAGIYGVSVITPDFPKAVEIMRWLRAQGAERVVGGGPHASLMPHELLEAGFDGVGVGDGELTMPDLLERDGKIDGWIKRLDELPHPDRGALDPWSYEFYVGDVRATSLMTSRGCIYGKCAFCSRYERGVRFHSAEYVAEELREIRASGFKAVMIYDDEFFTNPRRDGRIVKRLGDLGFTWRAFGRADHLLRNRRVVQEAARNGLAEVLIGVESGSDKVLAAIKKGTTSELNKRAIRLLHSLGVRVKAAFIVGLPGESWETIGETEKFIEETQPEDMDFTILTVYPGSDIWLNPGLYDVEFERAYVQYKGRPGEYEAHVRTSKMSKEEILQARAYLERKYKKGGIMRFSNSAS